MFDVIFKVYACFWSYIGNFSGWIEDTAENSTEVVAGIGAIFGAILIEYSYFSNAEEVRLLFVLLLLPVGGVIGGIVAYLLGGFFIWIIMLIIYGTAIAISLIPPITLIFTLYNIIVWTN